MVGLGLRMTQRVEISQEQALEQKFALRLELVQALRDEEYRPQGDCPECFHKLTAVEIIRGFNRDPNDFTTACPKCKHRFIPRLVLLAGETRGEMAFYCAVQALEQLRGKEALAPEELLAKHQAAYRSAIVHYGSIRSAFEKIGVDYRFPEISDWRAKVKPYLGRLPDTIVAECAGVSRHVVSRMRKKLGISRFTRDSLREVYF